MKKNKLLKYLLVPLSWVYGLITSLRNILFDLQILTEKKFDLPIISVGNITIGGTGKTPMVEYLISLLKDEFKVAVLSRGYKRKTRGFILADNTSSHIRIGDEPCQIKEKFPDVIVAVDADRVNGIKKIMTLVKDIDLIILDDAFQHRYVKPGLSILLVDFERPITKDYVLPFGCLRENANGKKRADIIVVTKIPENIDSSHLELFIKDLDPLPSQHLFFSTIIYENMRNVFYPELSNKTLIHNKEKLSVLLVCGIAVHSGLKKYVKSISRDVTELYFPDHHNYTVKDITQIIKVFNEIPDNDKIIITTEKDNVRLKKFVKIPEEIKKKMYYIPIKTSFIKRDKENFNNTILDYVRISKRNSFLYQEKSQTST